MEEVQKGENFLCFKRLSALDKVQSMLHQVSEILMENLQLFGLKNQLTEFGVSTIAEK